MRLVKFYSLFTFDFLFLFASTFAQVGIGTEIPNTHAVLDLVSPTNNQGLLVPRLTTSQRTATSFTSTLSAPEKGLLIYDIEISKFCYWNGTDWIVIEDSSGTDNQTLSFNPATGLLSISGGNNVNLTGTIPGGNAGGDLTGTYPNPTVNANAITTGKILDGTILNADISPSAGVEVSKLASGTNGQVLTTTGGVPQWSNPTGITGSGAVTQIPFWNATTSLTSTANLTWNNTNRSLTVNGSQFVRVRNATTTGAILSDDYIVYANGGITLTLPSAGTNIGRVLIIQASQSTSVQVNRSGSDQIINRPYGTFLPFPLRLSRLNGDISSITLVALNTGVWALLDLTYGDIIP